MRNQPTTTFSLAVLSLGAAAFVLTGCEQEANEPTAAAATGTPQEQPTDASTTLASELDARKASFNERADDEIKTLYAEGLQAVVDAGVVEDAKNVGDQAPGFTLENQQGEEVSLSDLLEDGPVVLLWYRGGWCPYCNLTLAAYQHHLDEIRDLGATLVALTPELPDKSLSTAEKNELDFQVLSDVGNAVAREYGVVFDLTEGVQANYEKNFGLSDFNGDDSGELPLAATYVIDRNAQIRWAFLDADYRNRAEPADVMRALEEIRGESSGG
ncbi:MAG: peroxiredoxin-like family protein [Phycisphaerales bacterium JB060]